MGVLRVERGRGSIVDRHRRYDVFIDGVRWGKLAADESVDIDLAPGAHKIAFHIDDYSSVQFVYIGWGTTCVRCSSRSRLLGLLPTFQPQSWIAIHVTEERQSVQIPTEACEPENGTHAAGADFALAA